MKKAIKRIPALIGAAAVFLIPVQAFAAEEEETMRQKLGFAAQNTVVGIVTVFCMLLLMALVIYLFRFLPKLIGLFQRKDKSEQGQEQETKKAASPPPVQDAAAAPLGAEQAAAASPSDAELVAVITAAIAAAREAEAQTSAPLDMPVGSFVVRTIKKRA